MSETGLLLDREAMQEAFRLRGNRLVARGVVADVYVIGDAAMVMAYDGRWSTLRTCSIMRAGFPDEASTGASG